MNFPDKEALASVLESSRVGAGIIVRPHELGIIPGDDPVNRAHFYYRAHHLIMPTDRWQAKL